MKYDMEAAIPHRAPFLLVDEVLEVDGGRISAAVTLRPDDELWSRIYAGHYPGNPITPGVLILEMLFQAAGIMIGESLKGEPLPGVPVVTRITNVKFRNMVRPGDRVELAASLAERLGNAFYCKGTAKTGGKTAVQAEFALALADPDASRQ